MRIRTCQRMTTRNKKMTKTKVTTMTLSTRTPKTSTNKATLIQFALLAVLAVVAWMPLTVTAFSAHSTFTSRTSAMSAATKRRAFTRRYSLASSANTLTMYDASRDPPSSPELNAWHVLGKTEQWISATLAASDTGMGNPYSRKEVSYACETHKDAALILANIFRHLREARELGEAHGVVEEDRAQDLGDAYTPHTLRQTQVIVIPGNQDFCDSFPVFDSLIESVNEARRNARDYVTDVSLEKLDNRMVGDSDRDWSVSVNCAHLHPHFGKKTPEEMMQELRQEEAAGEVDLNLMEYKEKRLLARQAPYPSIVIEVRASPPLDFGDAPLRQRQQSAQGANDDTPVSSDDVEKLEALFGKSAHLDHPTSSTERNQEEGFFAAMGQNIQELSAVTPLNMAQQWMIENDPNLTPERTAFTETNTAQVDGAYEFVFTNAAMVVEAAGSVERQYLVMPHFLSLAATSFEKFSLEVQGLLATAAPDLLAVETFHPEHIDASKRSPVPIFLLQRKEATAN